MPLQLQPPSSSHTASAPLTRKRAFAQVSSLPATEALVQLHALLLQKQRRTQKYSALTKWGACIPVGLLFYYWFQVHGLRLWFAYLPLGPFLLIFFRGLLKLATHYPQTRIWARIAHVLPQVTDRQATGVLLEIAALIPKADLHIPRKAKRALDEALARLLPQMGTDEARALTEPQRRYLHRKIHAAATHTTAIDEDLDFLTGIKNPQRETLVTAALLVLGMAGDTTVAEDARRLAAEAESERIQAAAQEVCYLLTISIPPSEA